VGVYTSSLDLEAYMIPAVGKEKPSAYGDVVVEMLRVEQILPYSRYFLGHTPKPAPVGPWAHLPDILVGGETHR
jgi:hypothetical protein